ncbi:MAG TPA: helix-turn-helix transcriptional regulator [Xanthobacteraceae bacterium]|nr:helix-turn-helix transcriptional regulator [Xanthobacteraceae bacterium]
MAIDNSIGDRLRRWRESLPKTQAEIADATKVGVRTLASYEAGESLPKTAFLLQIADMGCDIAGLLLGRSGVSQRQSIVSTIDTGLFKQVSAMVRAAQSDAKYWTSPSESEDAILSYYNKLVSLGADPAERRGIFKVFEDQYREEMQRRAAAAPGSSKASA